MKPAVFTGLCLILLSGFTGCDFLNPSAVDSVIASVGRDNSLDGDFWEYVTDLPGGDASHGAVYSHEGTIHVGFNYDVDSVQSFLWFYDIAGNRWEIQGDNPDPDGQLISGFVEEEDYRRYCLSAAERIFLLEISSSFHNLLEFDPGTKLITELEVDNLFTNLFDIDTAAANSSSIFIAATSSGSPDFRLYDPETDSRTDVTDSDDFQYGQQDLFCFSLNGDFYVGGGRSSDNGLQNPEFRQYDPDAHAWMDMPSLPDDAPWAGKAFVIDSAGYVLCSDGSLYSWTPGDDAWTEKAPLPEAYAMDYENCSVVTDGGRAYLVHEGTGFFGRREVYRYVP